MRIDRSHTPWILFVIVVTAGATLLFLANFYPQLVPFSFHLPSFFGEVPPARRTFGGTPLGLIFGTISFLIFLFASALGVRKKKRLWRIGNVQFWLKAHIWLTILTIPLVAYHCGFHAGGGHTTTLMVLYAFVMGSGFFGLALQQFMPRLMKQRLPKEVVFEQIPHIRGLIFEAALQLRNEVRDAASAAAAAPVAAAPVAAAPVAVAAGAAAAPLPAAPAPAVDDYSLQTLGEFMDEECLPFLHSSRRGRGRLGDQKTSNDIFRLLKLNVNEKWEPKVRAMQVWCDDRRYMDLQIRLHHWLHGWLIIHVPTSFALLIFTAWHAWVAVRFLIVLHP